MARILIADDSLRALKVIEGYLAGEGHEIIRAMNGIHAVKHIHDSIDLVITDIHMPGVDGLELAGLFRSMKREVPVIVITGFPDDEVEEKARAEGAHRFLVKPVMKSDLLEAVNSALSPAA